MMAGEAEDISKRQLLGLTCAFKGGDEKLRAKSFYCERATNVWAEDVGLCFSAVVT